MTNVFQSIKQALENNTQKRTNGNLKFEADKTYIVRFLPYLPDPAKSIFKFGQQGWTSRSSGQYVSAISPTTFGQRDPISEYVFKVRKTGSAAEKEEVKALRYATKFRANVYVVEDPTNPENNGQVKLLTFGKQIYDKLEEAIRGDNEADFGAERVFSLDDTGSTFRIKVTKQGEYLNFTQSSFTNSIKLKLTDEQKEAIMSQVTDPSASVSVRSYEELQQMFNEHWLVVDKPKTATVVHATMPTEPVVIENTPDAQDLDIDQLLSEIKAS